MEPKQSLYYGFGNIAYAVAKADGKVQREEYNKFHDIVSDGLKSHDINFDFSDIIFHILKGEDISPETAYKWGKDAIRVGKSYLSQEKMIDFVHILKKVAVAFGTVTPEENKYIKKFEQELAEWIVD
jgi:uncharacterized tellurite resistance protein B-like protein